MDRENGVGGSWVSTIKKIIIEINSHGDFESQLSLKEKGHITSNHECRVWNHTELGLNPIPGMSWGK